MLEKLTIIRFFGNIKALPLALAQVTLPIVMWDEYTYLQSPSEILYRPLRGARAVTTLDERTLGN